MSDMSDVVVVMVLIVGFVIGWAFHGLSIHEDCTKLGGVVIGYTTLTCEVKK